MVNRIGLSLLLLIGFSGISLSQSSMISHHYSKKPSPIKGDTSKEWFQKVKQDIRQRSYHIQQMAENNNWQSINRAQKLRTTFKPDNVTMTPISRKGKEANWHLSLKTLGLYANGEQIQGTAKDASVKVKDSMANFRHGRMTIQYLNTKNGVRQNFIVEELAEKPDTLEVKLRCKGSKVKQIGKAELQFYREESGKSQINYNDLKVWDANGKRLSAKFEPKGQNIHIQVKAANAQYPITIDPLSTTPDWTDSGRKAVARFGASVATAGDVNGDGYDDVIVGAYLFDNPDAGSGRVYAYHGGQNGLSNSPDWFAKDDTSTGWRFGVRVNTAGDVNGDGYDDVVVAKPNQSAYAFYGGPNGLSRDADWKVTAVNTDSMGFANDVGTAGDINGDGYDDVILGDDEDFQDSSGKVYVYQGSATGLSKTPDWSVSGNQENERFGNRVATAGDVNNDGYDDIMIGAKNYSDTQNNKRNVGRAYVFTGSNAGINNAPVWKEQGNTSFEFFGESVSSTGDVDGDGFDDVIVGAPNRFGSVNQIGSVYIYQGNSNGLSQNATLKIESEQGRSHFGKSVSTAGDVNGDGYDDVIVGAPEFGKNQTEIGKAFLYHGSPDGLDSSANWTAEGEQKEAEFGYSVSRAGDVNGDGFQDVIIGAWKFNAGQNNTGKAYVFYGDCKSNNPPKSNSIAFNSRPEFPIKDSSVTYSIDQIQAADTIEWDFPDDWVVKKRQGDTSIQVKVGTAGQICLTAANDCGEVDTCFPVKPVNPYLQDTTACEGSTLAFGPSIPNAQSIEWNTGDTTLKIRIDTSGIYGYQAITQDSTIYSDTAQVTIAPRPKVYVGPDKAFCGQIDYLIEPRVKGANIYQWNTGDTTKTLYIDEEGQYWLRVESKESCSNADTTRIQQIDYPESFDNNKVQVCEELVELDAGNPGASYQWNTGDTSQTLTVNTDGLYTVEIANAYCAIKDTVQVKVDEEAACPKLFVPNAFSPNGDGLNDVFKPRGQKIQDYKMTIYNRWGEQVFQTDKVNKGWNGRYQGGKAPIGTYAYLITYRVVIDGITRIKTKNGTLRLLK